MRHFDALLHVRGKSLFTADLPEPCGTLYARVFTSPCACGRIISLDTDSAEKEEGVVAVLTASDIPGENQIGSIIKDEPLFAEEEVHYIGQPIALVLAESPRSAKKASSSIRIDLKEMPSVSDPREACQRGLLIAPPRTFLFGEPSKIREQCAHVVTGNAETGGQEHLYLETQCALAVPGEDGTILINSSTQGASYVQMIAARVLGMPMHKIQVNVPRLGGAFGGKEDQATPWAVMAALGVSCTGRPVKLVLQRHEDMVNTGKRHPYTSDFIMGLDESGKIMSWEVDYYQNSGAAGDLSTAIMERTLFHCTGGYFVPNVRATGYCCRTNLAPNTAFRGFGGPQAMFVMEAAIHKASAATGIPVHMIQERNLLQPGDRFPYGMACKSDELRTSWNMCSEKFSVKELRKEAAGFNRRNQRFKKGVSMMPVCFGISFTTSFLNQASALVHVYTDGSVGISTGAVEMGQGVNSRIRQVAAETLGIPVDLTRMESTNTSRNANTSPTAASSGADMNGNAAIAACSEIKSRILSLAAERLCTTSAALNLHEGYLTIDGEASLTGWTDLVKQAYETRIDLSSHAHYATPGLHYNRETERGHPFAYHVCGTAVTVATVDSILGTYEIDRVGIVHHGGKQLNPLIDLGQVEGALIQGMGWVTMEELVWDKDSKRLLTDTLATYKVPDMSFIPHIEVMFARGDELPENIGLMGSKAVGEPPFMYGIGSWFAIMNAIGKEADYIAPMTPEKVLMILRDRKR